MTHNGDAYSVLDFSEKKMIGKPLEVYAASDLAFEVKSERIGSGQIYERVQFVPKLIAQVVIYAIVMTQNMRNIPLN
jgi:hypothetical protein